MYEEKKSSMDQENNQDEKTGLIIRIIFIFFGLVILFGIGFYFYYSYNESKNEVQVLDTLVDDEFNDLFKEKKEKGGDEEEKQDDYVENNCYIEDVVIKSGEKIRLFSRKIVNPYENCKDFSKERICNDGFMLGDDKFKFSSCKIDVDCQLPDNSILKNGKKIKLYSKRTVPFGETCERYASYRVCKETVLAGDDRFIYKNCNISYDNSCDTGNGHILANNQTHIFYKKSVVPYGESCNDFSKRLMCSNASIQGGSLEEYRYWDCMAESPKDCYIDGIKIDHGSSRALYSKEYGTNTRTCDFYKEIRACSNGVLDGQEEYYHANCYDN